MRPLTQQEEQFRKELIKLINEYDVLTSRFKNLILHGSEPNLSPEQKLASKEINYKQVQVGYYVDAIDGPIRRLILHPTSRIGTDNAPYQWFTKNVLDPYYSFQILEDGGLEIELPPGDKFGEILSRIAWVFYTLLNPNGDDQSRG
jgi:hypothetical protein